MITRIYRTVRAYLAGPVDEPVAYRIGGVVCMNPVHEASFLKAPPAAYRGVKIRWNPFVPATHHVTRKERALRVWRGHD
jgi:hypothetical protein